MTEKVPVNLISTSGRIRGLTESTVEALMGSIADVGLLNPVTLCKAAIYRSGELVDGYTLVAGAHRLEACRRLGMTEIAATIVDLDEPHRIIAECDENLRGATLTLAERAEFTARRKWAYEAIHPEAKHGGDRRSDQVANVATRSFADETAAVTGKSARAVRRDAEIGEKVCDSALAMVKGTHLNTIAYLDKLKNLHAHEQIEKVEADLQEPPKAKAKAASQHAEAPAPQAGGSQAANLPPPTEDQLGDPDGPAWAAQEFRRVYDETREARMGEDPDRPFTLHQYVLDACRASAVREKLVPIFLALLGLSRDPWPGLTREDIKRMIKGRVKDAGFREIYEWGGELNAYDKLLALCNRDWLEAGPTSKPKRRGAPAEDAEVIA